MRRNVSGITWHKAIYYGITVLTSAFVGLIMLMLPYLFDDHVYMLWFDVSADGFPWPPNIGRLLSNYAYCFNCDNIRLANTVAAISYIGPKWLTDILSAIIWGASLLIMGRLAGLKPERDWAWMAILCLLTSIVPMWYMGTFVADYQLNYIWATGLTVSCLWLFIRPKQPGKWIMFTLGLITGAWHEGFSLPLLVALSWLTASEILRDYRNAHQSFKGILSGKTVRNRIPMISGLFLGLCYLGLAKGTAVRYDNMFGIFDAENIWFTIQCALPVLIFYLLSAIVIFRRPELKLMHNPTWQALVICCAVPMAIKAMVTNGRAAWLGDVIACAGIVYMFSILISKHRAISIVGILSVILMGWHHIVVAQVTHEMSREYDAIVAFDRTEGHAPSIFVDLKEYYQQPLIALGKPLPSFMWRSYADYYKIDNDSLCDIAPHEIKDFTPDKATKLPSGLAYSYNDRFVATPDVMPNDTPERGCRFYHAVVTYPLGTRTVEIVVFPFHSLADNQLYYYIHFFGTHPFQRPLLDIKEYIGR